jgi:RNA polymerase sigma-70 factor (ECF subfamily)
VIRVRHSRNLPGERVDDGASLETIEACRRGDRAALDHVFRHYAPRIENLLARLVGRSADLQDLLQETLTAALKSFPRYRGEDALGTWLSSIAVNIARSHLRRPRRHHEELGEHIADDQDGASDAATRHQLGARLVAHLDHLDANKRIAFVLHVLEDMPLVEVAALMGASHAATKSRVLFARRILLKRLKKDPAFTGEEGSS